MIWFYWVSGLLLGLAWFIPVLQAALHIPRLADIAGPPWAPPPDALLPPLTIIVPARNEEAALEPALRSLLYLDYAPYQVIALNDRSTDRTGAIMERIAREPGSGGRLHVIHIENLPPGWLGKTHAMWLGAQQGAGGWILFTDADCVFHPDSLRRALHYAATAGIDHLVVFPTLLTRSLGERMMVAFFQSLFNFNFTHRPWKVADAKARDYIGFGAFNLVRREAYEAMGSYKKLRLEVIDDMKLGQEIKKAGFRQNVALGRDMVSLHWGTGALGLVRNLEKNLFAYLHFRVDLALAVCVALAFCGIGPFLGLALAPGWAKAGFALAIASCAALYFGMSRYTGISTLLFVTYPVAAALFLFTVARSAFLAVQSGGIVWRGTKYSLAELRKNRSA